MVKIWSIFVAFLENMHFTSGPVILIFTITYLAWRKSRKLFEPVKTTNLKVGHWSRYCKAHSMVKNFTDFCKVWIGIRWDPAASLFRYESKNTSTLRWSNFMYPENKLGREREEEAREPDQCKYRTYDKKGNVVLR